MPLQVTSELAELAQLLQAKVHDVLEGGERAKLGESGGDLIAGRAHAISSSFSMSARSIDRPASRFMRISVARETTASGP
jgi:hypothetical protein